MNDKKIIELYNNIKDTLLEEDKEKYEERVKKIGYYIGWFDKQGRYYVYTEFETETSEIIRTPSGRWPLSVWKHIKTKKYLKSLLSKLENDNPIKAIKLKEKLDKELQEKEKTKLNKL